MLSARDLNLFWLSAAELMGLQLAALLLAWWIRITALQVSQDVLATLRNRALSATFTSCSLSLPHPCRCGEAASDTGA